MKKFKFLLSPVLQKIMTSIGSCNGNITIIRSFCDIQHYPFSCSLHPQLHMVAYDPNVSLDIIETWKVSYVQFLFNLTFSQPFVLGIEPWELWFKEVPLFSPENPFWQWQKWAQKWNGDEMCCPQPANTIDMKLSDLSNWQLLHYKSIWLR